MIGAVSLTLSMTEAQGLWSEVHPPRLPWCSAGKEPTCSAGDLGPSLGGEEPLRRERLSMPVFWPGEFHGLYSIWDCNESDTTEQLSLHLGFLCESVGKESACSVGDLGSIPGLGRPPGEGMAAHSSVMAWRIPWTV